MVCGERLRSRRERRNLSIALPTIVRLASMIKPIHHRDTETQRKQTLFVTYFARMNTHQDTKRFIRVNPRKIRGNAFPPCFRPSVVKALIWPSPADDVLRTRSSAGPARRG